MDTSSTADKIRQLRLERGLTLEQVAKIVGVGKSTVRKWETGMIENMRRDKIAKLAFALGTTPEFLIGWDELDGKKEAAPQGELSEEELALLSSFRELNEEGQEKVLSYVNDLIRAGIYKRNSESGMGQEA